MKNILVTGGAGFIGSHTVVELTAAGYNPVILDNLYNSDESTLDGIAKITGAKPKFYKGDFADKKLLADIFTQEIIDGVIHFAAYKAVGESLEQPLKYYQNNIAGLISLVQAMEEYKVPNLVFSSSCTVYGNALKLPITEDEPVKAAESPYGATKQMGETIIHDTAVASDQLKALALRYFNPIAAHPSALIGELPKSGVPNLIPVVTQAAAGLRDKLIIHGDDYDTVDGTCVRDYIHVVDLAKAHVKAIEHLLEQNPKYYEFINCGTGQGNSVLEVIKTFEKVTGQKVPYEIGPRRSGDVVSAYAAVDKAQKILGWQAELNLESSLADAWRWQQTLK